MPEFYWPTGTVPSPYLKFTNSAGIHDANKIIDSRDNIDATNSSNFGGRLGGRLNAVPVTQGDLSAGYDPVSYDNMGQKGYWWGSLAGEAWSLDYDDTKLVRLENQYRELGFSVRCVKDV